MTHKEILKKAIEKYDVDSQGRVYNKKRGNELKPATYNNGYKYICVCVSKGVVKKVKVHRMVAYKYIPNPENKPFINHKDCNPSNNDSENLEWCTQKENVIHGFKMGRKQWNKGKLSKSQIYRICKKYPRKMFWILTTNNFQVAKAFWKDNFKCVACGRKHPYKDIETKTQNLHGQLPRPKYEYHLKEMILEENPILYLSKFLDE